VLNLAKVGCLIPPARKALRFSQHSSTLRDDSCLKLLGFGALAMIRYYEMSCPVVVGGFMTSLELLRDDVELLVFRRDDVELLRDDVELLRDDVELLWDDVELLRDDVELLRDDVELLRDGVELLRDDVELVRGMCRRCSIR